MPRQDIVAKRQRLILTDMDFDEIVVDDGFGDSHIERVERTDLFGALIRAALKFSTDVECKLTIREVIGYVSLRRPSLVSLTWTDSRMRNPSWPCRNLYIFLLAGHETTANSL